MATPDFPQEQALRNRKTENFDSRVLHHCPGLEISSISESIPCMVRMPNRPPSNKRAYQQHYWDCLSLLFDLNGADEHQNRTHRFLVLVFGVMESVLTMGKTEAMKRSNLTVYMFGLVYVGDVLKLAHFEAVAKQVFSLPFKLWLDERDQDGVVDTLHTIAGRN